MLPQTAPELLVMILTEEGRAGLDKLAEITKCGAVATMDPRITAALKWIKTLPPGPIQRWLVHLDAEGGCQSCPFETQIMSGLCGLDLYTGAGEHACTYDTAPETCQLRRGPALVDGVLP
jgi:hypothetical protein